MTSIPDGERIGTVRDAFLDSGAERLRHLAASRWSLTAPSA